jgi:hypothetical protein
MVGHHEIIIIYPDIIGPFPGHVFIDTLIFTFLFFPVLPIFNFVLIFHRHLVFL